ncbi:meiotic recombination protein REC8 homolog isoform X2 [Anas platyrhynchos]|uniref:meiotic recombination protein REC8 homolog isoform X2 n=1 Tax=Anas platyrhynchos TaxID=8839 RepID=UPI003AF30F17
MFYHPEVLQRRSGCFGTIWLAATCSSRLLRREAMAVDVPRTCAALLCFVLGSAPPPGSLAPPPPPGAPPPRCSLYLAALLQLGLARVYGRQCQHTAEEAAQVLERLNRAQPPPNIDISPPRRPQLLPDARALMATLELAPDPFFGVMAPPLPSPTELMELPRLEEELPPMELPELTVSPEIITLREPEPPMVPALERCGAQEELPEVTPRELELLSEAEVELLPTVEEVAEVPRELPPPHVPPVREEPGVLPPEAPRRRKVPRLPHSDPQPQIPQAEFRALLLQPEAHCQPLVIPEPPSLRRLPPAELFQTPTIGWLPPELRELWGRGARPGPVELPSEVEVPREALEPSLPVVLSSAPRWPRPPRPSRSCRKSRSRSCRHWPAPPCAGCCWRGRGGRKGRSFWGSSPRPRPARWWPASSGWRWSSAPPVGCGWPSPAPSLPLGCALGPAPPRRNKKGAWPPRDSAHSRLLLVGCG